MRYFAHHGGLQFEESKRFWQEADRLGFYGASCMDHPQHILEAWTLLTAVASLTHKLRVCPLVGAVTHRHPPWLAYQLASLDVITEGRVICGLGAGWNAEEHAGLGLALPEISERIARLEETIRLLKVLWTEERPVFEGRFYRVERPVLPRPMQQPHPPVLVGGRGPRLLRVVARHADMWNPGWDDIDFPLEEGVRRLRAACREQGRSVNDIEIAPAYTVYMGETESEVEEAWAEDAHRQNIEVEELRTRLPGAISGTPEQVSERIEACRRAGANSVFVLFRGADRLERMREFAKHLIAVPARRGTVVNSTINHDAKA